MEGIYICVLYIYSYAYIYTRKYSSQNKIQKPQRIRAHATSPEAALNQAIPRLPVTELQMHCTPSRTLI